MNFVRLEFNGIKVLINPEIIKGWKDGGFTRLCPVISVGASAMGSHEMKGNQYICPNHFADLQEAGIVGLVLEKIRNVHLGLVDDLSPEVLKVLREDAAVILEECGSVPEAEALLKEKYPNYAAGLISGAVRSAARFMALVKEIDAILSYVIYGAYTKEKLFEVFVKQPFAERKLNVGLLLAAFNVSFDKYHSQTFNKFSEACHVITFRDLGKPVNVLATIVIEQKKLGRLNKPCFGMLCAAVGKRVDELKVIQKQKEEEARARKAQQEKDDLAEATRRATEKKQREEQLKEVLSRPRIEVMVPVNRCLRAFPVNSKEEAALLRPNTVVILNGVVMKVVKGNAILEEMAGASIVEPRQDRPKPETQEGDKESTPRSYESMYVTIAEMGTFLVCTVPAKDFSDADLFKKFKVGMLVVKISEGKEQWEVYTVTENGMSLFGYCRKANDIERANAKRGKAA